MDEVRETEMTDIISGLAGPFAQAGSNATHRFCEQGQSIAKMMAEWNAEMSHFLSHRVARNGVAIGSVTKCQSLPEVFSVQARWVQDAADDYLKEMSKLMEVNSRIMVGLLGSVGQTETGPSPTKAPMRATG